MQVKRIGLLGAAVAAIGLAPLAQADTVFEDDFSDNNRDGWHLTRSGSFTVDVSGGEFVATLGTKGGYLAITNIPSVTLSEVGHSITVTATVSSTASAGLAYGIGLFNSNGTVTTADNTVGAFNTSQDWSDDSGIGVLAAAGTGNQNELKYDDGTTGGGPLFGGASFGSFGGGKGIDDADGDDSVELTISYVSSTELSAIYKRNGETVIDTATQAGLSPTDFTFNELVFGGWPNSTTATFDDVLVTTTVPEPASMALMGLGGLLMLSRRRAG